MSRRRSGSGGTQAAARGTPVVAVADPRTYSVIVTADKDAMPDIAAMISQLDSSAARKQKVFVYTLENADVRQVETVLKNLFQSANARSTTSTTVGTSFKHGASRNWCIGQSVVPKHSWS